MTPTGTSVRFVESIISSDIKGGRVARNAPSGSKKLRRYSIPRGLPRPEEARRPLPLIPVWRATTAGASAVKAAAEAWMYCLAPRFVCDDENKQQNRRA